MKESSVLRAADGLPGRVRSAAERLSRAASCGRTSGRCLRSVQHSSQWSRKPGESAQVASQIDR